MIRYWWCLLVVYVFLPVADAIDRFERWLRQ